MPLGTPTLPVGPAQVSNNTVNVWLSRMSRLANLAPKVGLEIAGVNRDGVGKSSFTRRINERSRLSGVATFAVGANAPEARSTLTPTTITADLRGLMTFLRDDAEFVSFENELATNQQQLLDAYAHFWHMEILDLLSSIAASTGTNATAFDLETWDVLTSLFRNDNHPDGVLWAVLAQDAVRDLKASLRSVGGTVFATVFGERKAQALASSNPGLGIPFEDYMLYETGDGPAGDTTGWTSAVGVRSDAQPLDSAFSVDVYLESHVEYQRDAPAVGQVQVCSGIAGCGIQAQGSARAQVTRT